MNLKQLRAFREVMLTGSVSEAARNLYRTQPAISSLISGLEEELGCDLFVRRGGRLHPVPEAHYLFEEAGSILSKLDSAELNIKSLRDLESGVLRIVAMPGPSVIWLPELISQFVAGRDGVDVQMVTRSSPQVHQLMSTQHYDVGLADLDITGGFGSNLTERQNFPSNCLCALPKDHPLASQKVIHVEELSGEPLAVLQADHVTRLQLKNEFQRRGADFKIRFETQYFIPLFTFIENGQACSVVDPVSARSYQRYRPDSDAIVFRPFAADIDMTVSLITPTQRPLSNLAQAFRAMLVTELSNVHRSFAAN